MKGTYTNRMRSPLHAHLSQDHREFAVDASLGVAGAAVFGSGEVEQR